MRRIKRKKIYRYQYAIHPKKPSRNILFPKKYTSKRFSSKILIFFIAFFILIAGAFFIFSPWFQIKNIVIETERTINEKKAEEIVSSILKEYRFGIIPKSHFIFFPAQEILKRLREAISIEDIILEKNSFDNIRVIIKEKKSKINLLTFTKRFLLDEEGNIFQEVPTLIEGIGNFQEQLNFKEEKKDDTQKNAEIKNKDINKDINQVSENIILKEEGIKEEKIVKTENFESLWTPRMKMIEGNIVLYDMSNSTFVLGGNALSKEFLQKILFLNQKIPELFPTTIEYYKIPFLAKGDISIHLAENWEILFDLEKDIQGQINNFELVYKEKFSQNRDGLHYIDLRFDERVYYK